MTTKNKYAIGKVFTTHWVLYYGNSEDVFNYTLKENPNNDISITEYKSKKQMLQQLEYIKQELTLPTIHDINEVIARYRIYSVGTIYGDKMMVIYGKKDEVNNYIIHNYNRAVMYDHTQESMQQKLEYCTKEFPDSVIYNIEELLKETA